MSRITIRIISTQGRLAALRDTLIQVIIWESDLMVSDIAGNALVNEIERSIDNVLNTS